MQYIIIGVRVYRVKEATEAVDKATEATEAMEATMEAIMEVMAATEDSAIFWQARGALHRQVRSKGMWRHGGSTEETIKAVEEVTAATADLATTRARGASSRPWRIHNNSGKIGGRHM